MAIVKQFTTAMDFWNEMVEPDYADYGGQPANLRAAFHAAISLFHMHDWVWRTHESAVRANFTCQDKIGRVVAVNDAPSFANSLEQGCHDFGRIRSIANAAKHLELNDIRPVPNAASHAANTAVHVPGAGRGGYGVGAGYGVKGGGLSYAGQPRVMLAGPNGADMEFSDVAKAVYGMWVALKALHGW
jgi:hypothetical protein